MAADPSPLFAAMRAAAGALALEAFGALDFDLRRVEWENVALEGNAPPAGAEPWVSELLLPVSVVSAGEGYRGLDAYTAIQQLTVRVPPNEGTGRADAILAALHATYRLGRRVHLNDGAGRRLGHVECTGVQPGARIPQSPGNWIAYPHRLTLRATATRAGTAADGPLTVRLAAA